MSEGNFEAKVSAKRETSAGIFLTVQIQPDDYGTELATLRVGSALVIGWAEVVNTKVEPIEPYQPAPPTITLTTDKQKDRRPFSTLPLSQQAAIRCNDADFQKFLKREDADGAADEVRLYCEVDSRADINIHADSGGRWLRLEARYQEWLTTKRYASVAR